MKKLVILLLVLFIPTFIFADVYGPNIEPYVAEVINKEGAHFYGYDLNQDAYVPSTNVLEYGTKIAVYDEFEEYAVIENYDDFILLSDIQKTSQSYEDYKAETGDVGDIAPLDPQNTPNSTHNNTIVYVISGVIIALVAVIIIVLVNKKKGASVDNEAN